MGLSLVGFLPMILYMARSRILSSSILLDSITVAEEINSSTKSCGGESYADLALWTFCVIKGHN